LLKKIIEARKAKQQQQLANEKRGEVVQLITNVRKLKRLGKKQMRQIIERSL
jgi:hypothetical protein